MMRIKFKWIFTLLLVFSMQFLFAQEKTVSGVVSDSGMPLPGAGVVVKGTSRGTQTDFDGNYSIKVSVGETLEFSFVGMKTKSAKVGASNTINVVLDSNQLDEVVVLGYGRTKTRNEITGSVVTVKADDIIKVPFVSADQALQGKVAGLTVSASSGTPGSIQEIRIRGRQSINASNEPLYVIDGVPLVSANFSGSASYSSLSALSSIGADNIESMTVLKDAAATSAYGARGSNGVIIITTKKGKKGDAKFSFSSTTGFSNNAVEGLIPLNGAQKQSLIEDAVWNSFGTTLFPAFGFSTRADARNFIYAANVSPQFIAWDTAGRADIDWSSAMQVKDAAIKNYDLSVSSGDEKSTFYASLGYNKSDGTVIGTDFTRVSGSLNYSRDLNDKLKMTFALNGANTLQNGILEQGAFFANPNLSRYFLSPWINPYNTDGSLNTVMTGTSLFNNIYTLSKDINQNDLTRVIQGTTLEYKLTDNLKFTSVFNMDYALASFKNYQNPIHGNAALQRGYTQASVERNFNYTAQNSLDYNFTIAEKHKFNVKGLIEFQKNKNHYLYGYGENFPNAVLTNIASAGANYDAYSSFTDWMQRSYMALVNYNLDEKYLVDFTYRNEGSSRFTAKSRIDDFYSVGAAWNINKEDFMANLEYVNLLRIRGSYGLTGNSGIGTNTYQSLLAFNEQYDGNPASYPSGYGNLVTWEKSTKNDYGIEYGLFDNRLSGSVSYYANTTSDMLLDVPLSLTQGFSSTIGNVGEMINKGMEYELSYDIFRKDNFNWSVSGNYATVKNEVTKMPASTPLITSGTRQTEVGHQAEEWFLRTWAGVDPANGDPLWYINGVDGATTNNINAAIRVYQGASALPTYSGGFSTHLEYKGFFVDGSVYFAGGHKIFEDWAGYTQASFGARMNAFTGTTVLLEGTWQQPGDVATHPRMAWNEAIINTATNASSRWLYDGDFLRLRDVAFGYTFKKDVLDKIGLDGVRLALRGTNLLTWAKDDRLKYDPEVRSDGFTRLSSPPVKSIVFQLNLNF